MIIKSLDHLKLISNKIAEKVSNGDYIFLIGEIGVGKTTFTRNFINYLQKKKGVKQTEVLSPTFNLLYEYEIKNLKVMHYDLYRIKNIRELEELDFFENVNKSITLIEWPELLIDMPFKKKHYLINLDIYSENKRVINIKYFE